MLRANEIRLLRGKSEHAFSLELKPGEIYFLVGPNGSGKTTLGLTLSQVIKPLSGFIETSIKSVPYLSASASIHGDLWGYEVADIMMSSVKEKNYEQCFSKSLLVENLKSKKIKHLSTGEQRRIFLASILALDAPLTVLDEPTSHLDWYFLLELKDIIEAELKSGKSYVIATHDFSWMLKFKSSTSLLMSDSSLMAYGPSSQVLESKEFESVFNILTQISDNSLDQTKTLLIAKN